MQRILNDVSLCRMLVLSSQNLMQISARTNIDFEQAKYVVYMLYVIPCDRNQLWDNIGNKVKMIGGVMIYILVNSDLTGVEERVTCDTPGWPPSPPHLTCPPTGENYHQHNQRNFSNQSCLSQNNLLFSLRDIP